MERAVCPRCKKGHYEQRRQELATRWGPSRFRFQQVPVWVCSKCGHVLITGTVSRRLETLMKAYLRQATPSLRYA